MKDWLQLAGLVAFIITVLAVPVAEYCLPPLPDFGDRTN
jgi:hypothetical protein